MLYARYISSELLLKTNTYKDVLDAFNNGSVHFFRWGWVGKSNSSDAGTEIGKDNVHSIITLSVTNDRITPFATNEEINEMFLKLLKKQRPLQEIYTSNNFDQQLIEVTFPQMF